MAGIFGTQFFWVGFNGRAQIQTSIVHGLKDGEKVWVTFLTGAQSPERQVQAIKTVGDKGFEIAIRGGGGGGFGQLPSGTIRLDPFVEVPTPIGGTFDDLFGGPVKVDESFPVDEPGRDFGNIDGQAPVIHPVVKDPGDTFGGLNLPGLEWGGLDPRTNAFASGGALGGEIMAEDSKQCACEKQNWLWLVLVAVGAWWLWKGRK